jgi:hypothetical protein
MGKDTEGMSTLKEMNYHVQDMPDGCWNCKQCTIDLNSLICLAADVDDEVHERGICSRYEKEAV